MDTFGMAFVVVLEIIEVRRRHSWVHAHLVKNNLKRAVGSEASMGGLRLRNTAEQVGMAENSRMTASLDDRGIR